MIKERQYGWYIINNDVSHVPYHQIITFEHLWKHFKPGGFYILEDIETSYYPDSKVNSYEFKAGIHVDGPKNSVICFKKYIDVINRHYFVKLGSEMTKFSCLKGDSSIMEIDFSKNIMYDRKAISDT